MSKSKEKETITKADVGEFPPRESLPVLLKPPASLVPMVMMTEAEAAFAAATGEKPQGPTKLPAITISHRDESFILPDGSKVDGHDGIQGFFLKDFTTRSYYSKAYDSKAEKAPPDCRSSDCITPDKDIQEPQSKSCLDCPHNAFGSAKVGKGKACREFIRLFLVNPEFGNPPIAVVTLPPTAMSKFYGGRMVIGGKAGFLDQLRTKHRVIQIVWNKITLYRDNPDDVHCMVNFEMGDVASKEVSLEIAKLWNAFKAAINQAKNEPVTE